MPAFPSQRQRSCAGLKLKFYPEYERDLVDVDYADRLPEAARVWLASFLEEHYRGWRLKGEAQIHSVDQLRASNRDHYRRYVGHEPHRFVKTRDDSDGLTEDAVISELDARRRHGRRAA